MKDVLAWIWCIAFGLAAIAGICLLLGWKGVLFVLGSLLVAWITAEAVVNVRDQLKKRS